MRPCFYTYYFLFQLLFLFLAFGQYFVRLFFLCYFRSDPKLMREKRFCGAQINCPTVSFSYIACLFAVIVGVISCFVFACFIQLFFSFSVPFVENVCVGFDLI